MGLMEGKKGIIFGVSNKFGIANAIAEQVYKEGGEIAFTYANELMEKRVRPIAESMNAKICLECDVTKEEDVKKVFDEYAKTYDKLDFVVHAVAFANKEDLVGDFYTVSREGWDTAMHISALGVFNGTSRSLIPASKRISQTSGTSSTEMPRKIATAGAVLSRDAKISFIAALSRKPNRPSGFRLPLKLNSCNRR